MSNNYMSLLSGFYSFCFYAGLSDPFVLVQLCSEQVFENVPVQKTKIIKKTLNPTFEETFEL